jgi:hypothetical protein
MAYPELWLVAPGPLLPEVLGTELELEEVQLERSGSSIEKHALLSPKSATESKVCERRLC